MRATADPAIRMGGATGFPLGLALNQSSNPRLAWFYPIGPQHLSTWTNVVRYVYQGFRLKWLVHEVS